MAEINAFTALTSFFPWFDVLFFSFWSFLSDVSIHQSCELLHYKRKFILNKVHFVRDSEPALTATID